MDIKRNGTQPSGKGPAEWFTGTVRIDPLFKAPDLARVSGASVTFEPGARTAWHTHPLGQTLIVTAGSGLAQREGGPVPRSGTSTSEAQTSSASLLNVSASCLIAFTMNCPQPQPASTTRPATITPHCTLYRAPFTMRSADSMRLLPKTRSIIRNW